MVIGRLHQRFVVHEATAVLRHDLRNKLASVRNASFYLRRRVEKDAPALAAEARIATFFGLTGSELDAAEEILAEQLPKLPEIALAPVEVDAVFAAVGLEGAGGLRALANADELAVALACLRANAIEAGARTLTARAAREGAQVVIAVDDDGPGLDAETARRAPEPFFTTRAGHLGLGLPIVKRIAARANGAFRFADRFELVVPHA